MTVEHHSTAFYVVDHVGRGVVIRRTARRHESLDEVAAAFASIYAQLEGMRLFEVSLVVDLRAVVGRNDESFEAEVAPHRRRLIRSFERVAILVRTAVGALQVKRMFVSEGIDVDVFTSEDDCLRWLKTKDPTP